MPRIYSVVFTGTVTAAGGDTDLFSLQPATNKTLRLRELSLGQNSEVGDAAEEGLRITIRRMLATFTVGSGGAVITAAVPIDDETGTVWGFTARANDTTVATTSGTNQVLREIAWNIRSSPYDCVYPDDRYCPTVRQGGALVVRLETTLADDITVCLTATVEEL